MALPKLVVKYKHDPADLQTIYLAVGGNRIKQEWVPAYRDTVNGQSVIFIRTQRPSVDDVWIKDSRGVRKVPPTDIIR